MGDAGNKTLSIVMIEDDIDLCEGWKDLFRILGHELFCYQRAIEALADPITINKSDLIITDYYLPDLNGIEFIHRVRKMRFNVPVILLTGSKEPSIMEAATLVPACEVVHKPINIDELEKRILSLCGS